MKDYIIGVLSFIGGAALSGVIVWKVTEKAAEKKYKAIADEEIKSVTDRFTVPKVDIKPLETEEKEKEDITKPSLMATATNIAKQYTNYSNTKEPERKDVTLPWEEGPYIIKPDDYGKNEEYDQIDLTLYADGILADDKDDFVDKEVVGDALDHMGEYDDDVIHVCDPKKKCYYEIMADNRSYEDATGRKPPEDDKEG